MTYLDQMQLTPDLTFEIVEKEQISANQQTEILELCSAAYQENFRYYMELLPSPVHILARQANILVSHAAWVTRWLQVDDGELLRTAYIEAVATAPQYQGRGFASSIMRELVKHITDFDLAALSPSDHRFYERFGWELWRGPLAIRTDEGLLPTPEEQVMIYRLPRSPKLDLDSHISVEWRPGEVW